MLYEILYTLNKFDRRSAFTDDVHKIPKKKSLNVLHQQMYYQVQLVQSCH